MDALEPTYRMKDLCRLTGLSRQAIHFYIQQGLLPEGRKTGRNMAWYGPAHVERLELIRKLQKERLLPLKAIKALLEDEPGLVQEGQKELLLELKSRLGGGLVAESERGETVAVEPLLEDLGLGRDEVERMAELGLIGATEGEPLEIRKEDVWMLELWSQIRAAGFSKELGFTVDDLQLYEEVVAELFRAERRLVLERLAGVPMEQVAEMMERVLPLIHTFLGHSHTAQVRNFFAAME